MIRPGDLTGHSDFHLFKEGIKPMWEVGVFYFETCYGGCYIIYTSLVKIFRMMQIRWVENGSYD